MRVDADMPAHRHGMNYRATVATLSPGGYRAERPDVPHARPLARDLRSALEGRTLRLTREIEVQ